MKSKILLSVLFVGCSAHFLMSMEEDKKSRLNFELNHLRCIKGYSAQNMEYDMLPDDFLNKNILDAVPLNAFDRDALDKGFIEAVQKKKTVKVPYTLKDEETLAPVHFLARITSLNKAHEKHAYFVKVTQLKYEKL